MSGHWLPRLLIEIDGHFCTMADTILAVVRHVKTATHMVISDRLRVTAIPNSIQTITGNCRSVYYVKKERFGNKIVYLLAPDCRGHTQVNIYSNYSNVAAFHDGVNIFNEFESSEGYIQYIIRTSFANITFRDRKAAGKEIIRRTIPMQNISYLPSGYADRHLVRDYLHELSVGTFYGLSTQIGGVIWTCNPTSVTVRDPRVTIAETVRQGMYDIDMVCCNLGSLGDTLIIPTHFGMTSIDTRNLADYNIDAMPYAPARFTYE